MNKVLLSKQEADALENALELNGGRTSEGMANVSQYHGSGQLWEGNRSALNDIDLATINNALYVGYEVEPGPEEYVFEYYNTLSNFGKVVVQNTLDRLSVQIKGINC